VAYWNDAQLMTTKPFTVPGPVAGPPATGQPRRALQVAAAAVLFSLVSGTLMALARLSRIPFFHYPAVFYIDVIRGIPVFLTIIFTFFGLGRLRIETTVAWSVTIAGAPATCPGFAELKVHADAPHLLQNDGGSSAS